MRGDLYVSVGRRRRRCRSTNGRKPGGDEAPGARIPSRRGAIEWPPAVRSGMPSTVAKVVPQAGQEGALSGPGEPCPAVRAGGDLARGARSRATALRCSARPRSAEGITAAPDLPVGGG